jgi:hypothetical protein
MLTLVLGGMLSWCWEMLTPVVGGFRLINARPTPL